MYHRSQRLSSDISPENGHLISNQPNSCQKTLGRSLVTTHGGAWEDAVIAHTTRKPIVWAACEWLE